MKRTTIFVLLLLVLSALTGYLLSKASLVGRVGISLFYTEYKFLKVWWQGGLLVFVVWMILFFLQGRAQRKLSPLFSRLVQLAAIVVALLGLYFTYQDFRHNTSHRLLGERFHLGGYLFWIGWIIISVYSLSASGRTNGLANEWGSKNTPSASSQRGL